MKHYDLILKLKEYNQRYNTSFSASDIYALFPKDKSEYGFFQSWPNGEKGGVYVIFDENRDISYIGTGLPLGRRLNEHFQGTEICRPKEEWKLKPSYLVTIPVADDAKWERLSLEAFLISMLSPYENVREIDNSANVQID